MKHIITVCFLSFTLVACGGTAAPNTSSTVDNPTAVPPARDAATLYTTPAPLQFTAAPITEVAPTTEALQFTDDIQRGYTAIVLLQGTTVMLEETAQQIQSGQLKGVQSFGQLIAVGAMVKGIDEALAKDAPTPELAPAWIEARKGVPLVRSVLGNWMDKKINSSQVADALVPAKTQINQALDLADQVVSSKYNVDTAKLHQVRDEALDKLRNAFKEKPTVAPGENTTAAPTATN